MNVLDDSSSKSILMFQSNCAFLASNDNISPHQTKGDDSSIHNIS